MVFRPFSGMLCIPCQTVDKGYVSDKRKPRQVLSTSQKKRNKKYGTVRAKAEYVFCVIKCQFGYRKGRYRRLKKNEAQMFSLMAWPTSTSRDDA